MAYHQVWVDDTDILDEMSDSDLIDELEDRGYVIVGQSSEDPLFKIRQSFLLDSPNEFRKFVIDYLNKQGMPV
jgi:hypothetical protein